jgi:hypothetical protein
MASPEYPNLTVSPSPTRTDLTVAPAAAIENPIERFLRCDQLLELHDWLQAELDLSLVPPELS